MRAAADHRGQRAHATAHALREGARGGQCAAERAPDGLSEEHDHCQGQHSEPQVPVVIERQVAIVEVTVGREVEQQKPAQTCSHDQSRIPNARRKRLRRRRQPLREPGRSDQQRERGPREREHERRGRREKRCVASGNEGAIRAEGPGHPADPRGHGPHRQRKREAGKRHATATTQFDETEADEHPCRPLPAGGAQKRAHRLVLGRLDPCLPGVGDDRCASGEGLRHRERIAAGGQRRRARKERRAREPGRRAVTVECGAEHEQCIGRSDVAHAKGDRCARERRTNELERARERLRSGAVARAESVTGAIRAQVGVDRLDRIGEGKQIAEALALLQTEFGASGFGDGERTPERAHGLRVGVGDRRRHRIGGRAARPQLGPSAEAVAHGGLGKRAVARAKTGQDRLGQSADGDRGVREAAVATVIVSGEAEERRKQRGDRGDGEQRLDERWPSRRACARGNDADGVR